MIHRPVLLQEVIQYLDPRPGENFIDATFGGGGHSREILKYTAPEGMLLGIDWDPASLKLRRTSQGLGLETGSENLSASEPLTPTETSEFRSGIEPESLSDSFHFVPIGVGASRDKLFLECGNFADIEIISKKYFPDGVDGVLFDFGFSTDHLESSGRGFSYLKDEPLDMRYSRIYEQRISPNITNEITASKIVNEWPERELERIFREFGEERQARKIARAVVEARRRKKIRTTGELVAVIDSVIASNAIKTYARIFQVLRIAVNDELTNIRSGLAGAWQILKPGGRLTAISFHSLEDRIVKNFFNEKKQEAAGQILTKKPVTASAEEIANNSRARSAKLRAIKRIATRKIK